MAGIGLFKEYRNPSDIHTSVGKFRRARGCMLMMIVLTRCASAAEDSEAGSNWFSAVDDRFMASLNGATLSGAGGGGGGGGSASWVEDLSKGAVALTADYESLGKAHWAYGALSAAFTIGAGTYYAEIDRGGGNDGRPRGNYHFPYNVTAVGAGTTVGRIVTLQLESRQIDVDATHGNLPKGTLECAWMTTLRTSLSYARSVSGNLGTEITSFGLEYDRRVTWLAGVSAGHVSPPVVDLEFEPTVAQYRESYLGIFKETARARWSVLLDYLSVAASKRTMLSVSYAMRPEE